MNVPLSLPDRIQGLLQERQQHADAIAAIDKTLEQINALLGAAPAWKPAAKPSAAAIPAVPARKRPLRPGELPTTGTQSILAFVQAKGNPTTRQINTHFKAEGRNSAADSLLGVLVKQGRLKKKPLGGGLGSEYSLTSVSAAAAVPAALKKAPARRRTYKTTAEELIIAFVKQKGQPTSQDIKKLWANSGRGGRAENELSRLVKIGKLKRTPLKDKPGSRYSLA